MTDDDASAGLVGKLGGFLRRRIGAGIRVDGFAPMPDGHAGLTFGFRLDGLDDQPSRHYVLRMAPAGVTRRGNTDVFRQAPLLRALHAAGLPVPSVPWAEADDEPLGAPFIVMERLPGRVFLIWEPDSAFARDPASIGALWLEAAAALARFHRLDWNRALADWEAPTPLAVELRRWDKVLRHAQDAEWLELGLRAQAGLLATEPTPAVIGLVHGDYQPGNVLYGEASRLHGVIDWELASIGAQGLDLGWLMMMGDREAWAPEWAPVASLPPAALLAAYVAEGGPAVEHADWFQAFAAYRMASIACLNVKLHRTGRRPDPLWDRFAPAIPYLFRWAGRKIAGLPPTRP